MNEGMLQIQCSHPSLMFTKLLISVVHIRYGTLLGSLIEFPPHKIKSFVNDKYNNSHLSRQQWDKANLSLSIVAFSLQH